MLDAFDNYTRQWNITTKLANYLPRMLAHKFPYGPYGLGKQKGDAVELSYANFSVVRTQ